MAVTQQLARIPGAQLAQCRASADELDRLCGFKAAPDDDHLDLDWAPGPLNRVCELAGVDAGLRDALLRSLEGGEEVNPAYRDHPAGIFEHPVTALEPQEVAEVAAALRDIDMAVALAALPSDAAEARAAIGRSIDGLDIHPRVYLEPHFAALRDFYDGAAQRGLATVLWWD